MRRSNRRVLSAVVFLIATLVTLSGCASRTYVQRQVNPVQARVTDLETATQEQAERISAVDSSAQQGLDEVRTAAQAAQESADRAREAAASAARTADAAQQALNEVGSRVTSVEGRLGSLHDYAVAEAATVRFTIDSAALTDATETTLNRLAGQVRPGDVVELIGHADSTGSVEYNLELSHRRAQSVQRHLMGRNVDLFKLTIAGLGEASPAAVNTTTEGREQNRRVEVRLLRPAAAARSVTDE